MSLWRRRISTRVPKPINPYPKIGNPFENEWLEKFVRADRFDVRICSVTKAQSAGKSHFEIEDEMLGLRARPSAYYEIFGYLIDPISKKMIYADISFEEDERFGGFVFDGMNSRWNDADLRKTVDDQLVRFHAMASAFADFAGYFIRTCAKR